MEGNVDKMRKDELMKYARSLGVATRKEGTKTWRAIQEVRQDCKAREAAQQERSRAHAGEPGSASSGVAVRSASRGPALAQTLSADTVEPGSASSSQIQASQTAVDRHIHGARRRRRTPPDWAETFATAGAPAMEPGSSDERPIASSDATRRLPNDFVNKPVLLREIYYLWGRRSWLGTAVRNAQ